MVVEKKGILFWDMYINVYKFAEKGDILGARGIFSEGRI